MYHQPQLNFTPEQVLDYLRKSQSDDPLLTVAEVLQTHEQILDDLTTKLIGGVVPEHNKFREIVSGESLADRPEMQKLLRLIESPKIKAVACVEPQRLTRGDYEDIGRLMKLLKYTDTLVITQTRVYNLRDEYDWDAFERELKRGNDYLLYYKKIQNRGRLASVAAGNYIGSVAPYGYDKTTVKDGKKKCPTLKPNPEQAPVVQMIFDMFVNQNIGMTNICNRLDELAIKPPRGKYWSMPSLRDMLQNDHYIGKVRWNWTKTVTTVENGEIKTSRPRTKIGEYLVYDGKHDAIVSEEIFNAAQSKIGKSDRTPGAKTLKNPFASLLFCAKCGRAITLRPGNPNRGMQPRLICDGQTKCQSGSCLFDDMVDRVEQALMQSIEDFEMRLQTDDGTSAKLHATLIKNLEKKQKELEEQELSQWEAQTHPDPSKRMPDYIFQQLNEKLRREKEEVQDALCKAYESMPEPVDYEDKIVTFKTALAALRDPNIDGATKNAFLKECIEKIEYHRDRPERMKRTKGVPARQPCFPSAGGRWTNPPITLDVILKP